MQTDIVRHYKIVGGHILQVAARQTSWRTPTQYKLTWEAVGGYLTRELRQRLETLPSIVTSPTEASIDTLVSGAVQGDLIAVTTWSPPKPGYHDHGAEDDWSGDRD